MAIQTVLSAEEQSRLRKAGYILVGERKHSAVKICLWTKRALRGEGFCYKQRFYGIRSHRCLQFTPALPYCSLRCAFCWRDSRLFKPKWTGGTDEPGEVIDQAIEGQRKLLNGFPGNPKAIKTLWVEAQDPKHAAISLDGEPTLYEKLPELIKEFHKRGFTTFLVTNGTRPEMLERLESERALPTQLYVSACAFDEASYKCTLAPVEKNAWRKLGETLDLLPELGKKTRTVMRLTLVRELNFPFAREYAQLVEKAQPWFVEPKAFMNVGASIYRLKQANMPSHSEIMGFSKELAEETGYVVSDEQPESRVALLCRDAKVAENRFIRLP
jgi:tRNA wybutosine-synthesizing protein 1